MVNGFKTDNDRLAKETQWLDRQTTPYSEMPYQIRGTCEAVGMKLFNTVQSTYGMQLFPHANGWNAWDMNSIYLAGQTAFAANSQAWTYSDPEIELANSKIDQLVCSWNMNVLYKKNEQLADKVESLKTQIQINNNVSIKRCPYV
jgi:hypothetical protein